MDNFDSNKDGQISEEEIERVKQIVEIRLNETKSLTQKRMAWTALFSMVIFTLFLFSPFISDSRVSALADLLGLFYIAQAGVVGAYMGVTTWLSARTSSRVDYTGLNTYSNNRSKYLNVDD